MRRAAHGLARAARAPACASARSLADVRAQRLTAPLNSSLAVGGAREIPGASRSFTSSAPASCAAGNFGASAAGARGGPPRFATLLGAAALGFGGYHALPDARKSEAQFAVFSALSPLMRLVDAETAHELGIELLARGVAPLEMRADDERLQVTLWADPRLTGRRDGLRFPNPVGLAAGFDKDAKAFPALLGAGFGYVEIGSVTPKPQPGNPKPRVFRLPEHAAVINRYGFNSEGHAAAEARLRAYREGGNRIESGDESGDGDDGATRERGFARPPLGVNLGKNKLTPEALAYEDYVEGVRALGPHADYLVVNVSSPNTPGLRLLQGKKFLETLMRRVRDARDALPGGHRPPVLLKIAPDLSDGDVRDVASAARNAKVDGIIVSNTTVARPDFVKAHVAGGEAGGLSGAPLMDASTEMLRKVYAATGGTIPLVGCGGVSDGKDAYRKIRAGASLVQLYTAFAYQGPGMLPRMKRELIECLDGDGFASVREAVGADHRARRRA